MDYLDYAILGQEAETVANMLVKAMISRFGVRLFTATKAETLSQLFSQECVSGWECKKPEPHFCIHRVMGLLSNLTQLWRNSLAFWTCTFSSSSLPCRIPHPAHQPWLCSGENFRHQQKWRSGDLNKAGIGRKRNYGYYGPQYPVRVKSILLCVDPRHCWLAVTVLKV